MEGPISFWGYREQESNLILPEHDDDDDNQVPSVQGHPNVHGTFIPKNFTVTHFTSLQNKITSHKSRHFTPHHYTSLHFKTKSLHINHVTSLHITTLHITSLIYTQPHFNSLACNYILNPLTHWHTQTSLKRLGSLGPLIHSRLWDAIQRPTQHHSTTGVCTEVNKN